MTLSPPSTRTFGAVRALLALAASEASAQHAAFSRMILLGNSIDGAQRGFTADPRREERDLANPKLAHHCGIGVHDLDGPLGIRPNYDEAALISEHLCHGDLIAPGEVEQAEDVFAQVPLLHRPIRQSCGTGAVRNHMKLAPRRADRLRRLSAQPESSAGEQRLRDGMKRGEPA